MNTQNEKCFLLFDFVLHNSIAVFIVFITSFIPPIIQSLCMKNFNHSKKKKNLCLANIDCFI